MFRLLSTRTNGYMDRFYSTAAAGLLAGFLPPDLPNLALWLRASSLSELSNGDPVTTWTDESGNGNDATPPGDEPTWSTAAGAVRFTAISSQRLDVTMSPELQLSAGGHIFLVLKRASPLPNDGIENESTQSILCSYNTTSGGQGYNIFESNYLSTTQIIGGTSFGSVRDTTQTLSTTNRQLLDFAYSGSSTGILTLDGTQIASGASGSIVDGSKPLVIAGFGVLGGTPDLGRYWDGWIYEIVIYDGALDGGDATKVRDYLTAKYEL